MKTQVTVLADTQSTAKSLRKSSKMISETSDKLNTIFIKDAKSLKYQSTLSIVLFILFALGLCLLTLIFYERSEIAFKGKKIAEKNQANENSINLLIKKMIPLDEGDFTQRVYVNDKFVGRIAEKVDKTREIFGNIVKKIKNTSILIKSSANETDRTSKKLLELSSAQYKKMGNSIIKLGRISSEMDEVAQTAWIAKEDALKSKAASEEGSKLVEESIKKMHQIRDTIQESSKKIKKSSESAQAITEVTGIIQNITKQIEILALNAAIQAASSGESGREFTVVAQAVQELALDSKEATKRILELVSDVQKDISSAVNSMEKTTQEVVIGAKLTDEAGKALEQIKNFSQEVAVKIEETSQKIEEKNLDMTNISLEMKELQIETEKTEDIVKLTSEQVNKLKTISEELENSVHGFKVEE
jgi:twitching motility protein PilJ